MKMIMIDKIFKLNIILFKYSIIQKKKFNYKNANLFNLYV